MTTGYAWLGAARSALASVLRVTTALRWEVPSSTTAGTGAWDTQDSRRGVTARKSGCLTWSGARFPGPRDRTHDGPAENQPARGAPPSARGRRGCRGSRRENRVHLRGGLALQRRHDVGVGVQRQADLRVAQRFLVSVLMFVSLYGSTIYGIDRVSRCPTIRPTLATSRHGNIREHCRQSSLLTCTILAAVALRLRPAAVASRSPLLRGCV